MNSMWSVLTGPYLVALDQRQQVALDAFAADRTAADVRNRDLVDLVEEDDAVLLGRLDRLAVDVVAVEALVAFLGEQDVPRGLDRHLPALGLAGHFAEHLAEVDHADLSGLHAGHFERHPARILDFDLDLAAFEVAVVEALLERLAGRLARVFADEDVEQTGLGSGLGRVADTGALALADQPDRFLDEVADDRVDVAADVADLGELGRLDLEERGFGELRQPAADLGLAAPGRADHQDVLRADLVAQIVAEALPPPAIAQRDRDRALGVTLADDVAVERGDDRRRGQRLECGWHVYGGHHIHPIDSKVTLSLV
jgi:hypothetical protein